MNDQPHFISTILSVYLGQLAYRSDSTQQTLHSALREHAARQKGTFARFIPTVTMSAAAIDDTPMPDAVRKMNGEL